MKQDLESLIAEVEFVIPAGWQWLLRLVHPDEPMSQNGKYFAHIYKQSDGFVNSHKGLGETPDEALLNAYAAFTVSR